MRNLIAAVSIAAAAITGYLAGSWDGAMPTGPDCPHEDSCSVDYRDGAWHIEQNRN